MDDKEALFVAILEILEDWRDDVLSDDDAFDALNDRIDGLRALFPRDDYGRRACEATEEEKA